LRGCLVFGVSLHSAGQNVRLNSSNGTSLSTRTCFRWYSHFWITENLATSASNTDLIQICTSVQSEGGYELTGFGRGVNNGAGRAVSSGVAAPLLSIRLKSARNTGLLQIQSLEVLSTGANDNVRVNLVFNGALTGASWSSVDADALSEKDQSATSISGGVTVARGLARGRSATTLNISSLFCLSKDIANTVDTITLVCVPSSNTTIFGTLTYQEMH